MPDSPTSVAGRVHTPPGGAGLRDAPGDGFTDVVNDQVHTFLHLEFDGCEATGRALDAEGNEVDRFVLQGCE